MHDAAIAPDRRSAHHRRDGSPPAGKAIETGWIEVALGSLVVVGVGLALVCVSLLNYGAVMAPVLAGVILLGVLGVRAIVPAGRARSFLTVVAGGMLLVALLSLISFVLVWIAVNNRGY